MHIYIYIYIGMYKEGYLYVEISYIMLGHIETHRDSEYLGIPRIQKIVGEIPPRARPSTQCAAMTVVHTRFRKWSRISSNFGTIKGFKKQRA